MSNRNIMLTTTLLLLLGAAPLLGACNTTAGAGKDISKAGEAIENSANRNAP
ncbi:entericidin A/B family lipoprotein [Elioraea sp.]|uniref:entericidin A/B family lipoprotein n=1 Tax=Elioraea sp. TaxID=2185103 RepID=UPI0025BADCB4|nr:entericidin A/B family lipoprotein [Elioraea sp.]